MERAAVKWMRVAVNVAQWNLVVGLSAAPQDNHATRGIVASPTVRAKNVATMGAADCAEKRPALQALPA